MKINTVFYESNEPSEAMINPSDFTKAVPGFPKLCISTFSKQIIDQFASLPQTEVIGNIYSANGINPIYKISYKGREIAFYLSLVGAPACVSCFEEVIAMGAEKFIFFGCCGVLKEDSVKNRIILPVSAVRDEGTSYHYVPPSEEIAPGETESKCLINCMDKCGYPYAQGKIWTTDAIYRETKNAIRKRKENGCIAVDMEYSALLAAAAYRKVSFAQFFYGADCLDNDEWQPRDLKDYGLSSAEKYFVLAMECVLSL